MSEELCFQSATELAQRIRRKELSARELMQATLAQIERANPALNAIVTLHAEDALAGAAAADAKQARGEALGPLHGLPVAHKDLVLTRGMRTTFGSPIFKDFVPEQNMLLVDRLQAAGAISIGKTNTPEFGAGSQTFNAVFGKTRNPYDPSKTCGGSSGGAAVALATGMVPLADGSDMGGSLRCPANFCNVVGMRTSPGRVPIWPAKTGWGTLSVEGPMARTVGDCALMLSVIAGHDARSPIAIAQSGAQFAQPLARDFKGVRIAFSPDLGGLPVDTRVATAIGAQRANFAGLGCAVEEATPDLADADEIFHTFRAWQFELAYGELLERHRGMMKDTVVWNIEEGRRLAGPAIGAAELKRTALFNRMHAFMQRYEFLVLPVNQMPPFDVDTPYVSEINGVKMRTYIDWMQSCYFITVTGHPAISVPCGFTPDGLPVGVQIVGRHQDDFGVLQLAYAFEQATQLWKRRPPLTAPAQTMPSK